MIDKAKFDAIAKIEPLLADMHERISAVKDEGGTSFCANAAWYGEFKPLLVQLVGFDGSKRELRSKGAYELAYDTLYSALPSCRNCACMGGV